MQPAQDSPCRSATVARARAPGSGTRTCRSPRCRRRSAADRRAAARAARSGRPVHRPGPRSPGWPVRRPPGRRPRRLPRPGVHPRSPREGDLGAQPLLRSAVPAGVPDHGPAGERGDRRVGAEGQHDARAMHAAEGVHGARAMLTQPLLVELARPAPECVERRLDAGHDAELGQRRQVGGRHHLDVLQPVPAGADRDRHQGSRRPGGNRRRPQRPRRHRCSGSRPAVRRGYRRRCGRRSRHRRDTGRRGWARRRTARSGPRSGSR